MQMILKRLKKEEKGFTLIELLAVIVILAVIAVIAVPLIGNIINKTKTDANIATARQIYDAARLYNVAENNGKMDTVKVSELQVKGYLEATVYLPSTKVALNTTTSVVTFNNNELESVSVFDTAGAGKTYPATDVLSSKSSS